MSIDFENAYAALVIDLEDRLNKAFKTIRYLCGSLVCNEVEASTGIEIDDSQGEAIFKNAIENEQLPDFVPQGYADVIDGAFEIDRTRER